MRKRTCGIDTSMDKPCNYYLLGDVSRMLGTLPHRIVYLLTTHQVPEPSRLGNRRLFCAQDVRRIAAKLGVELQQVKGESR
jgi:hypothetical protein